MAALPLRSMHDVSDPVLEVLIARTLAGSRPGRRSDDHMVCLAVEGGGMRGAVSSGMCVVLEAAGLIPAFDRIYGVSSGALNGAAAATGQAAFSATHYEDAATLGVINRLRPLRGRAAVDLDFFFDDLMAGRKPLSFSRLAAAPDFRALATSVETASLRVLKEFRSVEELMQAVRASASLAAPGGRPHVFRGETMVDGALLEPIPFEAPLRDGATHVLVLRSRPVEYRKPRATEVAERLVIGWPPEVRNRLKDHAGVYNRQARTLERLVTAADGGPSVTQIAIPAGTPLIGLLEPDRHRVVEAVRVGATAMASELLTDPIELCWQPVPYRVAPNGAPNRRHESPSAASRVQ